MAWVPRMDLHEPLNRYLRSRRRAQVLKLLKAPERIQRNEASILAKRREVLKDIPDRILDKTYELYANDCRADEDARESARQRCVTCKRYWANVPQTTELLKAAFGHHIIYEEASGQLARQLKADIQPCPHGVGPPIMDLRESYESKFPVQLVGSDTVGPLICTDFEEVER